MFERILVPLDGSDNSNNALETAVRIAKKFDAEITLIHVYADVYPMFVLPEPGFIPPVNAGWIEAVRRNGVAILTQGKKRVEAEGIQVETLLIEGHIVTQILETCKEGNFDLIVMGARGLSAIKELFLGSVSHGVTTHVRCPVLIVK